VINLKAAKALGLDLSQVNLAYRWFCKQARPTSLARLERGQRRGVADRNRAEPAAPRQAPLPTAAIDASQLCGATRTQQQIPRTSVAMFS
jgi:hypothetical protein